MESGSFHGSVNPFVFDFSNSFFLPTVPVLCQRRFSPLKRHIFIEKIYLLIQAQEVGWNSCQYIYHTGKCSLYKNSFIISLFWCLRDFN